MSKSTDWPTGGRRLNNAERQRIIDAYLNDGKSVADRIATEEYGLSETYAYTLLNARGLIPRGAEPGGRHAR
jgi:transposase-like protein